MQISVIISTYNNPEWLEKVLWGYAGQIDEGFELVIADDGSGEQTRSLIEHFKAAHPNMKIRHVWHEDDGFRKSIILNKATVESTGDYLIFSDGDCVPRPDFVSLHRSLSRPGYFLSGGYYKLPMSASKGITIDAVKTGKAFNRDWLIERGLPNPFRSLRISSGKTVRKCLDLIIPTKATWNGNNSSAFKADILKVNGHDERMAYGGQDVEMGYRLINAGVKPLRVRYRTLILHLDHARGYASEASIKRNLEIRESTLREQRSWTDYGIERR